MKSQSLLVLIALGVSGPVAGAEMGTGKDAGSPTHDATSESESSGIWQEFLDAMTDVFVTEEE